MRLYFQIIAVYIVIFTQMLDTSVVNLALVKIAPDLGINVYNSAWILTAFGAGMVVSFPLGNSLSKRYDFDTIFLCICITFIVASFACAMAVSDIDFVIFRFIQGLASGSLIVFCQSLLFRILGDNKRAAALGLWSSAVSIAPIIGPLVGGIIIEYVSWRWIFFINLPLMLFCLYILLDVLNPKWGAIADVKIHALTLIAFAIAVALAQYVLDFGERNSWFESSIIVYACIGAIVGLCVFLLLNRQPDRKVFDFSVFRDANYRKAMSVLIIANGLIFASLVVLPVWLQVNYGMPAIHAGLVVAVGSGVTGILSPFVGKYLKKQHYFFAAIASLLFTGISFLMMSQYNLGSTFTHLAEARILAGIGLALFATPLAAMSIMTIAADKVMNANSVSMCLRVISSNVFVAVGFIMLQHQQHQQHENYIATIDRQFVAEYVDKSFTDYSYVTNHVATLAMQNVFFISGVIFIVLFFITILARFKLKAKTATESKIAVTE
jgi:MFS transporter, DHA2 family, multidrug resistance protein